MACTWEIKKNEEIWSTNAWGTCVDLSTWDLSILLKKEVISSRNAFRYFFLKKKKQDNEKIKNKKSWRVGK